MNLKRMFWAGLRLAFAGVIFVLCSVLELLEGGEAFCRRMELKA